MNILNVLLTFFMIWIDLSRSEYYEYKNTTVYKDDIFKKIPSITVTQCYFKYKNDKRCTDFAFLKTPELKNSYTCYLITNNTNRRSNRTTALIVAKPIYDVLDYFCPRKQSIADGREANPNCWLKSVDGIWSQWSNYGLCSCERDGGGWRSRKRTCSQPYPSYGGDDCLAKNNLTRQSFEADLKICGNRSCPAIPVLKLIDGETELIQNHLVMALDTLGKEYEVSFEVKPTSFSTGYQNIIQFTTGGELTVYGSRTPAVWLISGKLHISSAVNGDKGYSFVSVQFQQGKWISVRINQIKSDNVYKYNIIINKHVVHTVINKKAEQFHNVMVFAANPWSPVQPGRIRNLAVYQTMVSKWNKLKLITTQRKLVKNHLVMILETLEKEYKVSFEVKLTASSSKAQSIIHFTIGSNGLVYGSRTPGVWFTSGKLEIRSAVNGNIDYAFDSGEIKLDKWISVVIHQIKSDNVYKFNIIINGNLVHTVINNNPQEFHNVMIFAGDPWYDVPGLVRNFVLYQTMVSKWNVLKLIDGATELISNHLVMILETLGKEYKVSFEVKPTSVSREHQNIIHFTIGGNMDVYGSRIPSMSFIFRTLYVYSAVSGNKNYVFSSALRELDKWISVVINQVKSDNVYKFNVIINGDLVHTVINNNPQEFHNVMVFAGDPWYDVPPGLLRNFVVYQTSVPKITKTILIEHETNLNRNKLITTLKMVKKEFKVSFEMKPTSFSILQNIIHFTISRDVDVYGSRTPAVWITSSGQLYICSSVNGIKSYKFHTAKLVLNEWTSVVINQFKSDNIYKYNIIINGVVVHTVVNSQAEEFNNVKVYASNPWRNAFTGLIRNFAIYQIPPENE